MGRGGGSEAGGENWDEEEGAQRSRSVQPVVTVGLNETFFRQLLSCHTFALSSCLLFYPPCPSLKIIKALCLLPSVPAAGEDLQQRVID